MKALETAELALIILDGTKKLEKEDFDILDKVKNKKHIIIINKIDLDSNIEKDKLNDENIIEISTKTLSGIEKLEDKIECMFNQNELDVDNEIVVTNIRHKDLITKARLQIEHIKEALKSGIPIDMISIELQNAVQFLGEITGETVSEDVVNGIFKKFCVGK